MTSSTADDSIEKAATSTIGGTPYQVIVNADRTLALHHWLADKLPKYRASAQQLIE
jgi:hypothetical protein